MHSLFVERFYVGHVGEHVSNDPRIGDKPNPLARIASEKSGMIDHHSKTFVEKDGSDRENQGILVPTEFFRNRYEVCMSSHPLELIEKVIEIHGGLTFSSSGHPIGKPDLTLFRDGGRQPSLHILHHFHYKVRDCRTGHRVQNIPHHPNISRIANLPHLPCDETVANMSKLCVLVASKCERFISISSLKRYNTS